MLINTAVVCVWIALVLMALGFTAAFGLEILR